MATRLEPFTRYEIHVQTTDAASGQLPSSAEASFRAAAVLADLQAFQVIARGPEIVTGCPANSFGWQMIGQGTFIPPPKVGSVLRPFGSWDDDPSPGLETCSVTVIARGVPGEFRLPPDIKIPGALDPYLPPRKDPALPPVPAPPVGKGPAPNLADKPSGVSSKWALGILSGTSGLAPSDPRVVIAAAVSLGESRWGWPNASKHPSWQGHHNWGAIHCSSKPPDCECGFLDRDGPIGHIVPQCFRSWPTNESGAAGFWGTLYSRGRASALAAAAKGDVYGVALAMRRTIYFCRIPGPRGGCSKKEADIRADALHYGKILWKNVSAIQSANGLDACHWTPPGGGVTVIDLDPQSNTALWVSAGMAIAVLAGGVGFAVHRARRAGRR